MGEYKRTSADVAASAEAAEVEQTIARRVCSCPYPTMIWTKKQGLFDGGE